MSEQIELIDVKDLAKRLKVSDRHIRRMVDDGRIPAPLRIGSAVRWSTKKISDWIAAGCPRDFKPVKQ